MKEPFRSQKFIITVSDDKIKYKIFQIIFSRNDGSIFINFPYYRYSEGIASIATIPSNIRSMDSISLTEEGKVISHKVKYSHHYDGNAHFSQDGKIRTVIRKRAASLEKLRDHLFTVSIQGIDNFEIIEYKAKSPSIRRTELNFSLSGAKYESLKIIGRWFKLNNIEFKGSIKNENWSPRSWPIKFGKSVRDAFPLSAPIGNKLEEYVLLISCEIIPKIDKKSDSALIFIGGFDDVSIAKDITKQTTFLVLSYPVSDYKDLINRIGSIDYNNNQCL